MRNLALGRTPLLSVILCTRDRATLLERVLASLCGQTVDPNHFEVVVIDDGSTDCTRTVCEGFENRLPVSYSYQRPSGLASAKNHGVYRARGDILLFQDDDDLTMPTLLEEHITTHERYPKISDAVLGYSDLAPEEKKKPLMHYVTQVGCQLFSYPRIKHGDMLGFANFWGGRSSCKRHLLIEHGVFNPVFSFGYEDIELGWRLAQHGLRVVYNARAVTVMLREISFAAFCDRMVRQGRSLYVLSTLHPGAQDIQRYCGVAGSEEEWAQIEPVFDKVLSSAAALDKLARVRIEAGLGLDEATEHLLYRGYQLAFEACRLRGISQGQALAPRILAERTPRSTASLAPTPPPGDADVPDPTDHAGSDRRAKRESDPEYLRDTSLSTDHPADREASAGSLSISNEDECVSTALRVEIDWTRTFDYMKLREEEIEEYSNIEVTQDLKEGGIHAQKAWEYWFRYLTQQVWNTSLSDEVVQFCTGISDPRILSLGCGYGGFELGIAQSLKPPFHMVATDLVPTILTKAVQEARKKNLPIRFLPIDLNFVEIRENSFDVIFAHASLHHLLNLEHVSLQIYKGLKDGGRLIVQDIIGKTQVLFWKDNVDFAIEVVRRMPSRYKAGVSLPAYTGASNQQGMEGIRQEEIEALLNKYFEPVKMFKFGSFMRMICTHPALGKRFDPDVETDRQYLEELFRLDLQQVEEKRLRPTEMLAVLEKKQSVDVDRVNAEAHATLGGYFLEKGIREYADDHIEKALTLDPANRMARELRSRRQMN